MKNKNKFLALALLSALFSFQLSALDLGVAHLVLATPDEAYLEINLEIAPASVTWTPVDSTSAQASVHFLILIKKGDEIISYEKYTLSSPVMQRIAPLLDIRRFALNDGMYELEITATDVAQEKNAAIWRSKLDFQAPKGLFLSQIQLLRGFRQATENESALVKNGFYMEPLPFAFYDKHASKMAFYCEIYHSNTVITDPQYSLRYTIEKDLGNGELKLVAAGNQKKKPSVADAALFDMDISLIESGNYVLTIELRNKQNAVLATRKQSFQRSNPFLNIDPNEISAATANDQFVKNLDEKALVYSMKAISPMVALGASSEELKNILAANDYEGMRYFIFRYFIQLDPLNPELAWRRYMETANAADQQFNSGFRYGFETDRGRTFMKYGRPDDLVHIEDDPAAPPYEIWIYYNFPKTNQRNVKFLFYNPTLAGEDFIMLHSNARGEINNPKWEIALYKRNAGTQYEGDNSFDATQMKSNVNRRAREYFEDF